ncbi:MAG: hypothetical protein Q7T82_06510 [Armatimonadota bacterium]|nr:hypothetical protein [Armatimonadota bacterium]
MSDNSESQTIYCPKCGYATRTASAVCPNCYGPLPSPPPVAPPPPPRVEEPVVQAVEPFVEEPVAAEAEAPADLEEPAVPAEPAFGEAPAFDLGSIPVAPTETEPVSEQPAPPVVEPIRDGPAPGPFTGFILGDAPRIEMPEFEQPEPVDQSPVEAPAEQIEEPQEAVVHSAELVEPAAPVAEMEAVPDPVAEKERAPFDLELSASEPAAAVEEPVEPAAPAYDLSAEIEEKSPLAAFSETPEAAETPADVERVPFDLSEFAPEPETVLGQSAEPEAPVYEPAVGSELEEPVAVAPEASDVSETPIEMPQVPFDMTEFAGPEAVTLEEQAVEPIAEEQPQPSEFDTYAAIETPAESPEMAAAQDYEPETQERIPFDLSEERAAQPSENIETVIEAEQPWELPAAEEPLETLGPVDTAAGPAVEETEEEPAPFQPFEAEEHPGTEEPAPFDLTELPQAEHFDFAGPAAAETPIELSEQPPAEAAAVESEAPEVYQAEPTFSEAEVEQTYEAAPEVEEAPEPQAEVPATHHVIPTWVTGFEGLEEAPEAEVPEFAYPAPQAAAPPVEEATPAEEDQPPYEPVAAEERQPFDFDTFSIPEAPTAEEHAPVEDVQPAYEPAAEQERQPFDFDTFSIPEAPAAEEHAPAEQAQPAYEPVAAEERQPFDSDSFAIAEAPAAQEPIPEVSEIETPEETAEVAEEPWQRVGVEPFDLTELETPEPAVSEPAAFEEPELPVEVEQAPAEAEFDADAVSVAAEEPAAPTISTRFVLEDEPDIELAEFEIPRPTAGPVESIPAQTAAAAAGAVSVVAAAKIAAAGVAAKIAASIAAIAGICATYAVRFAIGAGKAAGRIGKVIKERSRRTLGLIARFRMARRSTAAPAAAPAPIEAKVTEVTQFEQGLLDRLAPAAQVGAWAQQLTEINADTDAALIELAGVEEARSPEIQDLIETVRSAVQEDARQVHEVRENPYSLYWTLWLKDERETIADDLSSLIESLDRFPRIEDVKLRLADLRNRYQGLDPRFYTHFGSLVLLYDLYPPRTIADLAAKCGASRCGRALS